MGTHPKSKGYIPAFADLMVSDWDYNQKVYERVKAGGFFTKDGKWRKIRSFPNDFWDRDTAKDLIRYFVLTIKGWDREKAINQLTIKLLRENQLTTAAKKFHSSTYEVVSNCFPEWNVKAWELSSCPNAFWHEPQNCAEACAWVALQEGIADDKDLFCQKFSAKMLKKYGIAKAMIKSGGLYELAVLAFPEWGLKPWDLKKIGKITDEMAVSAIKWMIEDELNWDEVDVCNNISVETFREYGIVSILKHTCHHSPIEALELAYPGVYKRSMLRNSENPFRN